MRLELQLRLKQTLAPQLIQSLKMLQMPVLRLEQKLRQELSTNPLLEEIETLENLQDEDDVESPTVSTEDPKLDPKMDKIDWDYYLGDDADDYTFRRMRENVEDRWRETPATGKTLYQHLLEQLGFLKLSDEEVSLGEFIIGNIDESGYLTCSVEEIAEMLKVECENVENMLRQIKKFDPIGVGTRNLQESLLIQLSEKGLEDSLAYRIINECFESLDRKSHLQLSKATGSTLERVEEAMEAIKTLSPKPTVGRFDAAAIPIVPDLIVEKVGEEYLVFHNDKNTPRLRINSSYRSLLKRGNATPSETKTYIREKLEQARWLLNSVTSGE